MCQQEALSKRARKDDAGVAPVADGLRRNMIALYDKTFTWRVTAYVVNSKIGEVNLYIVNIYSNLI